MNLLVSKTPLGFTEKRHRERGRSVCSCGPGGDFPRHGRRSEESDGSVGLSLFGDFDASSSYLLQLHQFLTSCHLGFHLDNLIACTRKTTGFTMASVSRAFPRELPIWPGIGLLRPCVGRVPATAALKSRRWTGGDRRGLSVYGYVQAKALVYSKYGEPKDVLQYGVHSFPLPCQS